MQPKPVPSPYKCRGRKEQKKGVQSTKELIQLITATDNANPEELKELYKEIIKSWISLNK